MKKAGLALVFTVSLSGCALPVGVTVATWAADGWSLLATNKSIIDHGISFVAEQDCALWRVFSDDAICSDYEDEGVALADSGGLRPVGFSGVEQDDALADYRELTGQDTAGTSIEDQRPSGPVVIASLGDANDYVPAGSSPWYRKTRNEEYLALMPEAFSVGRNSTTGKPRIAVADTKPQASAEKPMPAVAVAAVETSVATETVVASGQNPAPAIDIEFTSVAASAPAREADPVRAVVRERAPDGSFLAVPGRYFVIASFGVWDNATRFAARHSDLAAHIQQATVDGASVYRVVVGPYLPDEKNSVRDAIISAGVDSLWSLTVDDHENVAAWLTYDVDQVASLAAAPQS